MASDPVHDQVATNAHRASSGPAFNVKVAPISAEHASVFLAQDIPGYVFGNFYLDS
jgi:hypothetical protein